VSVVNIVNVGRKYYLVLVKLCVIHMASAIILLRHLRDGLNPWPSTSLSITIDADVPACRL
jgi:hypothetical protein